MGTGFKPSAAWPSTKKPTSKEPKATPGAGSSTRTAHHETEKPPPYTQNNYNAPLPAVPEASGSQSQYHHNHRQQLQIPSTSTSAFSGNTVVNPETPATVNQIHLASKKEDIIGTFHIDPRTPVSSTKKRKKNGKRPVLPHASFKTSSGSIQLSLATTGNINESPRANVSVASGSGCIELKLLPMANPARPRIGLDVISAQGDITVHLPETFSGLIQLNTRKGELHVLPALMRKVKVLKATDKETMVLMGTHGPPIEGEPPFLTDLCQLNSRSGKVIVGLAGHDKQPEKAGFWKKLGDFFRG
ncbi:hypothetical protein CC1G_14825 [Coprinopsis cinerea okayama7|uniref:DUF7330 domain-containing protein n=1 Tax=Coprinopsis cinerea (strain Okayama-7 / 130 / ATCC MYA-4618 / FGSC 9003) TaxID=240176 RepID=D6RNV0_COPC7|nr:hypothetical protein CC1G_14825 [Coprinopsis cinerea okayama7\|eukprot:XP_002910846.1 hypothetical protein CC1G_14825 [Coprinopsis cinerea okayama7\